MSYAVSSSDEKDGDVKTPEADHGGGTGGSSGISARSIDKFTNDFPDSESKIIKLSIKTIEPQVTSGSRGARNLGFSADASLNAIPGGLNNELTNVDLKVPAAQSYTVAKDSYGNPVTPYTELGTTGLDSAGFQSDVHRDGLQGTKNNQVNHLNFKVPSYASGIIEPVLLPPNPPANFINQQPAHHQYTPTTSATPVSTFQFVANAKIPTVDDGQISFAQKPLNGLIPPLFPGEQTATYSIDIATERSTIFAKDPFGGPLLDKELTLPYPKPPVDFNQGVQRPLPTSQGPLQVPLQTPQLVQTPPQPQFSQQPQQPQPPPTQATVQKFTGSFGGAPGFLGNQQNLGTAYSSTQQPSKPAPLPTVPAPPPPQFQPTVRPIAPTQAPNKFTGSFGGAPGFLGNQQNLGTAYKPTSPIPPTPQRPVAFQPPPPPPAPSPPQTQIPNIIKPPSPFQPPPQQQPNFPQPQPTKPPGGTYTGGFGFGNSNPQHHQQPQPTQAPGGIYTGGFGFGGNTPQQQQPQPTQSTGGTYTGGFGFGNTTPQQQHHHQHPLPTQTTGVYGSNTPQQQQPRPTQRPGQYVGNKFNGSFGGAPGLLGNQKQPGTHVKPDGSILAPSAPGVGFTAPAVVGPVPTGGSRPATSGSMFTGSFGGPPGVLRPFDNVNG